MTDDFNAMAREAICRLNRIKVLHDVEIDAILSFIVDDEYDIGGLIHRLRVRLCNGVALPQGVAVAPFSGAGES